MATRFAVRRPDGTGSAKARRGRGSTSRIGFTSMAGKIVIPGGTIYDGSGQAPFTADLAIAGDRITAIGRGEDGSDE